MKLSEEKNSLMKKHNLKIDPSIIKGDMDRLEVKLETEVISFEKEQNIVKKIKELKKSFNQAEILNSVLDKINNLRKEINKLKKEYTIKNIKNGDSFGLESNDINFYHCLANIDTLNNTLSFKEFHY